MKAQTESMSTELHSAENTTNNFNSTSPEEPIETKYVENTPFAIAGSPKLGYYCMWGKFIVSTPHKGPEEILEKILSRDWEILLNCMTIVAHSVYGHGAKNMVKEFLNETKNTQ